MYDPTDPVGRLLFNVLAMVAELESDLIRLRTREGMKVEKAKGRLRGRQAQTQSTARSTPGGSASWWRVHHRGDRRLVRQFTARARELGMQVLVEIHAHFERQTAIGAAVDRVYDFALPPLLLHSLYTGDAAPPEPDDRQNGPFSIPPPGIREGPPTGVSAGQGPFAHVVAGEGFEPSKLSRWIYRPWAARP